MFGLEDSGEGDSTITYAAYPGETPVFSSGREIKGWQKVSGELPGLPEEARGKLWVANVSDRFFTLYDAEGMLPRAQSERFVPLKGGSKNELHFPKGRLKNWPNVEDVDILVRPTRAWIMNVLPLVSVDEEAGIARTAIPATYGMNKYGCWVENVLEELDQPGEWVLNTKEGKVYLWPRGKSPVMAPQLMELIRVEGEIDQARAQRYSGPQPLLPWSDLQAWRTLYPNPGRCRVAARLGHARQGQRPGSPARYRELRC